MWEIIFRLVGKLERSRQIQIAVELINLLFIIWFTRFKLELFGITIDKNFQLSFIGCIDFITGKTFPIVLFEFIISFFCIYAGRLFYSSLIVIIIIYFQRKLNIEKKSGKILEQVIFDNTISISFLFIAINITISFLWKPSLIYINILYILTTVVFTILFKVSEGKKDFRD